MEKKMENEMETGIKWKMKWKLVLYRGLWGLGIPKIRGTLLGVPIRRVIVFGGLHWGPFILGNYHLFEIPFESCLDPIRWTRWFPDAQSVLMFMPGLTESCSEGSWPIAVSFSAFVCRFSAAALGIHVRLRCTVPATSAG